MRAAAGYDRRALRTPILLGVALAATALAVGAAAAPRAQRAAARPFVAKLTYHETSPGTTQGNTTTGVVGHGVFSAKLSGRALMAAALVRLATGVPVAQLARGGTWVGRYDIDAGNTYRGIVVARFKAPGLGTLCLAGTTVHGKFTSGFIPASGTMATLGGTGTAAKLRINLRFKQTAIAGSDTETFTSTGAVQTLSMGAAKPMSATCSAVARLAG